MMHLYNLLEWKLYQEFLNLWINRCTTFYAILLMALIVCNVVIGYLQFEDGPPKAIDDWAILFIVSFVLSVVIEVAIIILVPLVILLSLPLVTGLSILVGWLYLRRCDHDIQ